MRIAISLLFLSLAFPAAGRMYQWVEPETDTPQLSGKPPAWYRSREGGPRVLVFDKNKLIDDTNTVVPESEREQLRQEALIQAERDQAAITEKLLEAKRMQAVLDRNRPAEEEELLAEVPVPEPQPRAAEAAPAEQGPTIEAMRALVEQWDAQLVENAREIANGGAGAVTPSSPPP
jgi:hypothetical protein